jgi:hypothetical protein
MLVLVPRLVHVEVEVVVEGVVAVDGVDSDSSFSNNVNPQSTEFDPCR